jgi:putative hydrolase of the HAD superfamily
MKKLIIFDAMGVIYKTSDDVADLLIPYLTSINKSISASQVQKLYHKLSMGKISTYDFFNEVGLSGSYPAVCDKYLDTCLELDEGFIPLAQTLLTKYNMAMLSNDVSEWSKYLRRKFNLDKYFIASVISGDVGIRKPSAGIYHALLETTGYLPDDCIFIDDNTKNLEAANALGFNTIWFNRNNENITFNGSIASSMSKLHEIIDSVF